MTTAHGAQRPRDTRAHSAEQNPRNRDQRIATPQPPSNETLNGESIRQQTEIAQDKQHAPATPCGRPSDAHATFQRHRDQLIGNLRQGTGKFTNAKNTCTNQGGIRAGVTTIIFPLQHVRCRHSKICYLCAHLHLPCRQANNRILFDCIITSHFQRKKCLYNDN